MEIRIKVKEFTGKIQSTIKLILQLQFCQYQTISKSTQALKLRSRIKDFKLITIKIEIPPFMTIEIVKRFIL